MIHAENKSHLTEDICYYATIDNHSYSYLFDCGMARYLGAGDCKSIRAIFVTHTHIDHFSNFDTVLRHQLGLRRKVIIHGPKGIARNVQGRILSYTWNLIRNRAVTYEIRELHEGAMEVFHLYPAKWKLEKVDEIRLPDNKCFNENGIFARYAVLDHKIPSIAYCLEEESSINIGELPYKGGPWINDLKEAHREDDPERLILVEDKNHRAKDLFKHLYLKKGGKFGYAMDHLANKSNHDKMIELWKNADEVVIEGFFRECDKPFALKHYHSTAKESGKVVRLSGAKKLTLVHHSRRYFRELPDLREEAQAEFEGREPKYQDQPVARYAPDESMDE